MRPSALAQDHLPLVVSAAIAGSVVLKVLSISHANLATAKTLLGTAGSTISLSTVLLFLPGVLLFGITGLSGIAIGGLSARRWRRG